MNSDSPAAHLPVRVLPENPRWLEFRGRPIALVCATEHYGSVLNRPFDFRRYLAEHAARGHNFTRLFLLFRELESDLNPASPCKPASPDFIAPWPRTGASMALDGERQYDLTRFNDEYFERLHAFFEATSELGVVVEATLFSNSYVEAVWNLNPLNPANNIQGIGPSSLDGYNTMRDAPTYAAQVAYARRVAEELNPYDNFYFEVCNEPGAMCAVASATAIDEWQTAIVDLIRETETGLPNRHLVYGSQAFTIPPFHQDHDKSFAMGFDGVNIHPLPATSYGGRTYQMGEFMGKQLRLRDLRDFTLAVTSLPVPVCQDEDNAATCFRDTESWIIHRKRAWASVLCGAHYDMIDFTIQVGSEDGTPQSRAQIRIWLGILSRFVNGLDLTRARPAGQWLTEAPEYLLATTLAVGDDEYLVYLADERERDAAGAGDPHTGSIRAPLPVGRWSATFIEPESGREVEATVFGGGDVTVRLPDFRNDLAIHFRRGP